MTERVYDGPSDLGRIKSASRIPWLPWEHLEPEQQRHLTAVAFAAERFLPHQRSVSSLTSWLSGWWGYGDEPPCRIAAA